MIVERPGPFSLHVRTPAAGSPATATFDATGRLLSFRLGADHFRRGLDGSVVRLVRGGELSSTAWRAVRESEPETVLRRLRAAIDGFTGAADDPRARDLAERAAAGLHELWASDTDRFRDVLGCVPIVPPLHVRSVVLRLTEGCAYGRCRFCTLYDAVPFRVRDDAEWRDHVTDVLDWFGDGAGVRPTLWVGDASLLEAGEERLIAALDTLGGHVEIVPGGDPRGRLRANPRAFDGVHGFADVPRAAHLAADATAALAERGVRRLHLGLESGHAPLLRLLRKPHDGALVGEALRRLHEGGIAAGLVVLVGAGGRAFERPHHRDTVALVETLPLVPGDLVQVSPLDAFAREGPAAGDDPLGGADLAQATRDLTADLERAVPAGVRVADYGLEGFVY